MVSFFPQITFHTQVKTVIAKIIVGLAASHWRTIKANEIIGSALDPAAQFSKTALSVKSLLLSPLSNEEDPFKLPVGLTQAGSDQIFNVRQTHRLPLQLERHHMAILESGSIILAASFWLELPKAWALSRIPWATYLPSRWGWLESKYLNKTQDELERKTG